jgi:electron transport complex protein RnfC
MHGGIILPGAKGDLIATPITMGEVCLKVDAPAVTMGQSVALGEIVGTIGGRAVLSPFAGTVCYLSDSAVKISGDGSDRRVEAIPYGRRTGKTLAEATPEELLAEIRNAGIVEADGRVLADHIRKAMERSAAGKLRYAVVSLLEPDPASLSLASLGLEYADAVAGGLAILLKIIAVRQGTIVCDSAQPLTVNAIQTACRQSRLIAVEVAQNRYPMAHPKLFLRWLFQKEMSATSKPEMMGAFLIDAESCIALHQLFATGIPRLSVRTTFYENQTSRLYDLPLGMTLASLKCSDLWETLPREEGERHALVKPSDSSLWCMGLMNGAHPADPIDRSVTVLMPVSQTSTPAREQGNCIRCGRCVEACPMYLSPFRYLPEKPWMTLLAGAPRDAVTCIGCGCCSYVCPAELPLRRYVLRAKEEEQIRLNQRKKDAEQGNPPSDSSATPTATQSDNALPKNEQKGRDQQ